MYTTVAHPVGERLRQAREAHGMTLDDVSEATKIASRYLAALEEGSLDRCPGTVYTRGFVKLYARCVNLDVDEILAEFDQWVRRAVDVDEPAPVARPSLWQRFLGNDR